MIGPGGMMRLLLYWGLGIAVWGFRYREQRRRQDSKGKSRHSKLFSFLFQEFFFIYLKYLAGFFWFTVFGYGFWFMVYGFWL
ncbi:hypothetical protein BZA77DRAFT_300794 [Pyronema omphalodes]|nr:hypothetical protein BZA77DRAFT_300794 [Pyronema omphalodes]